MDGRSRDMAGQESEEGKMAPGPYKEDASEQARASRRSTPSALTTPEERRQRQGDDPPMRPKPDAAAARSQKIWGDRSITGRFKY